MSVWVETINNLLHAAVETCADQNGAICPATAFSPVAAAFATQGYFMQADILYYFTASTFGIWAPFLYMIAAIGGIISLALGAPPKMYLWFFIGPGIYHWLVETRLDVHGVQWQVGSVPQDQRAVWRMAHVGLKNSSLVARMNGEVPGYSIDAESEKSKVELDTSDTGWCKPTKQPVYVSNFFLQFDDVVSYTVRRLVDMTGIARTSKEGGAGALAPPTGTVAGGAPADPNRWYLMTDKKWALMDTITSARLNSAYLRDAFVTFLSSECGDALGATIDQASYVLAANSGNGNIPCTIMRHEGYDPEIGQGSGKSCNTDGAVGTAEFEKDNYKLTLNPLRGSGVPIPDGLRRVFQDANSGSFVAYVNGGSGDTGEKFKNFFTTQDVAECHQIFYTIIQGFRWEASQIYGQLKRSGPPGLDAKDLLFNLFYGWGARTKVAGPLIKAEDMEEWTRNLIFVHLIKNEMAVAPRMADKKFSNQLTLDSYSQNFTAQTGAKTKYGEVYSWARMVPYMQGVMLYLLAMGYPFACLMMVMPGWHKTLFTWMSFWVWVKLWDAGFAVVSVLERSIWAMLGNSTKLNYSSPLVYQMKNWSASKIDPTKVGCATDYATADCFTDMRLAMSCSAADPFIDGNSGGTIWWHAAALFDRGMALAASVDLDVANGYYIYLMSALYFAVPAATGQLVLGAKAGVAGMVNGLVQGIQQDGGRGASGGFLGDFRGKAAAGAAAVRQEAHARGLQKGGLVDQSFGQANESLAAGFHSGAADLMNRQAGLKAGSISTGQSMLGARTSAAQSLTQAGQAMGATLASYGPGRALGLMKNVGTEHMGTGLPSFAASHMFGQKDAFNGNPEPQKPADPANGGPSGSRASPSSSGGSPSASGGAPAASGAFFMSGADMFRSGSQMTQAMLNPIAAARGQIAAAGYSMQGAEYADTYGRQSLGLNADQASRNLASFDHSSGREAYGIGERRYGAAADFNAQSSVFYASSAMSDNSAGYIGSLGGDASVVSPTSKPTDVTGMAMTGRLGMSTAASANWAMNGFQSERADRIASLSSNFGSSYVVGDTLRDINASQNSIPGMRFNTDGIGNRLVETHMNVDATKKQK